MCFIDVCETHSDFLYTAPSQTYMAPEMSLFGPMDIDSYSLYANMRVYGMIILAIVSTIAFFGEKHVCCLLCYPIPTARCPHHAHMLCYPIPTARCPHHAQMLCYPIPTARCPHHAQMLCYPIPTARCPHHAQIDRVSNVCFFIVIFSIICMYAGFFTVATDEKTM